MSKPTDFKSAYKTPGAYDAILLPHFFGGGEDVDLVSRLLADHYGPPEHTLNIVEFGCGTGRVTARLAPYAHRLTALDNSPTMIDTLAGRFPDADARCLDTRAAVRQLLDDGLAGTFDIVATFWSLSYPLGDCFEELTAEGIRPVPDQAGAARQAGQFVRDLVRLVAPGGHLLALFFDSDTREQRLVTDAWEKIAPFPPGGRGYTRQLLIDELRAVEDDGEGWLTHTRTGGVAVAPSRDAARAWFNHLHFKDLATLTGDAETQAKVAALVEECAQPSGEVLLPSGVHVIDFHAVRDPSHHLPRPR
jgi:SAM-dependent methyltransferase